MSVIASSTDHYFHWFKPLGSYDYYRWCYWFGLPSLASLHSRNYYHRCCWYHPLLPDCQNQPPFAPANSSTWTIATAFAGSAGWDRPDYHSWPSFVATAVTKASTTASYSFASGSRLDLEPTLVEYQSQRCPWQGVWTNHRRQTIRIESHPNSVPSSHQTWCGRCHFNCLPIKTAVRPCR